METSTKSSDSPVGGASALRKGLALSVVVLACKWAAPSHGQNPDDMPLRQVISEAQRHIGASDLSGSLPFLDELEVRFETEKDPKVVEILQQFGFVRGLGYLQRFGDTGNQENLGLAAKAFAFFAEKFPEDDKAVMAKQKEADCRRALHEFLPAAKVYEELLDSTKPFFKKIKKRSDLLQIHFGRAQCYHVEQAWGPGEPAFKSLLEVADKAKDEDRSSYAVSCLVEMFVVNKRIDEVFPYLPRLSGDTPARYDLRLNVNLLNGAEQLKTAGRHVDASLFYALTMTTEEIHEFFDRRVKELTAERDRLNAFLKVNESRMPGRRATVLKERINALSMQVTNATGKLEQVKKAPAYTTTLRWRKAENFKTTKRDWEGFWAFYWLYQDYKGPKPPDVDPKNYPEPSDVENFIYAAFASANAVNHREKAIELGNEYLDKKEWTNFRPDVTFILSNAYRTEAKAQDVIAESLKNAIGSVQEKRREDAKAKAEEYYDRFFELCESFLMVLPEHEYARDFINMMGDVYFTRKRYDDLLQRFAGYENGVMNPEKGYVNNPGLFKSPAMPAAHYFSGLALLAMGKFEEAKPLLGAIVGASVSGLPVKDLDQIAEAADDAVGADPSDDTNPEEVPGG